MSPFLDRLFQVIPNASVQDLSPDVREYLEGMLESSISSGSEQDVFDSFLPFLADAGVEVDEQAQANIMRILSSLIQNDDHSTLEPEVLPEDHIKQVASLTLAEEEPVSPKNIHEKHKTDKRASKRKPTAESPKASSDSLLDTITATSQTSRFHVDTVISQSKDIDLPGVNIVAGGTELIVDTRLKLMSGVHYGLVGENGVGKTTLMKCIGYGLIPGLPKNVRILYVEQIEMMDTGLILVDSVLLADRLGRLHRQEKTLLEKALETGDAIQVARTIRQVELERALSDLEEAKLIAIKRSGARGAAARRVLNDVEADVELKKKQYDKECTMEEISQACEKAQQMVQDIYEHRMYMTEEDALCRAKKILRGLGFNRIQIERPLSELSSGWQARVALARALFLQPDVLLLDEPQNFLALDAILWLQSYLNELDDVTIVTVSHDRCFLNAIAEEIILFKDKTLKYYHGNYDIFEDMRQEKQKHNEKMRETIEKKKQILEKNIQDCISHAKKTGDDKKLGMAASRRKKLEERGGIERSATGHRFKLNRDMVGHFLSFRQDASTLIETEETVEWSFPDPEPLRHFGALLELEDVSFHYPGSDNWVLQNVTLNIMPDARIALVGKNGQGKSTLTGLMAGTLSPTKGIINRHPQAKIGFYTQSQVDDLHSCNESVISHIATLKPQWHEHDIRAHLALYGLRNQLVSHQPLKSLSGGQLVRVAVAVATLDHPHLLILDEVSAHLSLKTVSALVEAIQAFQGAVVLVSHDQWLVQSFGGTCYLVQQGHVDLLPGGVNEYVERVQKECHYSTTRRIDKES